ncbi:hypothetical protein [uncultured Parvimonas sp.]|uniref:hypothetical protein n=1 Tax=uncultured Parvimonas sp. TaxID=747372 RepID=UPI0028049364|nr:hypothetical protein [uncultured Parvimonas sp.]
MLKKELYLIKENSDLKNVYTREYIQYFNQEDREFIKKVRDLGYKFLLVRTEIDVENIYNPPEPNLTIEMNEDIIDPNDLLSDDFEINIEPCIKYN